MTLKRLAILLAILIFLAGVGIACLWQYAFSPQGRARVIIAQLKNDTTSLRGWLLQHQVVRPGFEASPKDGATGPREDLEPDISPQARAAADKMAQLGKGALPVAIEAFGDDSRDVQMMAVRACGELRDPAATQQMIRLLDCPPGGITDDICAYAVYELGKAKDPRATDTFVRMMNWPTPYICRLACISLGEIGDSKAVQSLLNPLQTNDRVPAWERVYAAGALARLGRKEGGDYLLRVFKDQDGNPSDRSFALEELVMTPRSEAYDPMISLLTDSDDALRRRAVWELGTHRNPRVIPAVRRFLKDTDPSVRDLAAVALRMLGDDPPPASQPGKP
jgi:HEAT repeat protein